MISGDLLDDLFSDDGSDLGEAEFLDQIALLGRAQRLAEVAVLRIAYEWVQRSSAQTVARRSPRRSTAGSERVVPIGVAGGEEIAEFSPAVLGARLGITTYAARELMADAVDLPQFFPELWRRVEGLEVKASCARHVVKSCRAADLDRDQMAVVDGKVATSADGRLTWSRFAELVAAAITMCDIGRAREAERKRRKATFARRLRGVDSGMASFLVRDTVDNINRLDTAVRACAETLASQMAEASFDERCAAAMRLMALGEMSGPDVTIHLHSYAGCPTHPEEAGFSRIDHASVVTNAWVAEVLGANPRATITIRPVIDLEGLAPVDAYEIPDRHRRAVEILFPSDVFPWGGRTGASTQIDHTTPWRAPCDGGPPGQTGIGNLGPLSTFHHRVKTHGDWQVEQPFPGVFLWRDPGGQIYLVDASGTRALRPEPGRPPEGELSEGESRIEACFGRYKVHYGLAG